MKKSTRLRCPKGCTQKEFEAWETVRHELLIDDREKVIKVTDTRGSALYHIHCTICGERAQRVELDAIDLFAEKED